MCPDPQLLSIYVDGELPSPWKEKMEGHLNKCPDCKAKYENFKKLHELFKKDTTAKRTYVERVIDEPSVERTYTEDEMQAAKERVWNKIEAGQKTSKSRYRKSRDSAQIWQRRLSIPIPAAAAAAIIIAVVTVLWIRGETFLQNGIHSASDKVDFILAAEEEIPILPTADIHGVLQYLASDGSDIIILRLPETGNFSRSGDPAMIRAADYSRQQTGARRRP